jgi:hypothetical protein
LLDDGDGSTAPPVVVVNETAANRVFAGRDALGQQIAFWGNRWTIVGVVGDEKVHGLAETTPIAAYTPVAQAPPRGGAVLLVRTAGDPASLAGAVRGAIGGIDPALAIFGMETLSQSLALAAIGIYGVLNYTVAERTREIGVRIALGASARSVTHLVVSQGVRLTLSGLVLGLIVSVLAGRALSSLLFGVTATDAGTLASVVVLLGLVGAIATWLPVRRAISVDPAVLFRS